MSEPDEEKRNRACLKKRSGVGDEETYVGEGEGEEEEEEGNLFDTGEGAVIDDRVSPRAPSKSVQTRRYGIRWAHNIYYDRLQQHTGEFNDIEKISRYYYSSFTISRPRPRMGAKVISMRKNG